VGPGGRQRTKGGRRAAGVYRASGAHVKFLSLVSAFRPPAAVKLRD